MKKLIVISSIVLLAGCNPYKSTMEHTKPALINSRALIIKYVPETAQPKKGDTLDMIDASEIAINEALKSE